MEKHENKKKERLVDYASSISFRTVYGLLENLATLTSLMSDLHRIIAAYAMLVPLRFQDVPPTTLVSDDGKSIAHTNGGSYWIAIKSRNPIGMLLSKSHFQIGRIAETCYAYAAFYVVRYRDSFHDYWAADAHYTSRSGIVSVTIDHLNDTVVFNKDGEFDFRSNRLIPMSHSRKLLDFKDSSGLFLIISSNCSVYIL
jgi:hypothetical protein